MTRFPLHGNVYSYREGVSTDTALHNVVSTIENAGNKRQFELVTFLDISGAFSNTATKEMVKSLALKGVEKEIVLWTKHLLTGRTAIATISDCEVKIWITTGVAEGVGVDLPTTFQQ